MDAKVKRSRSLGLDELDVVYLILCALHKPTRERVRADPTLADFVSHTPVPTERHRDFNLVRRRPVSIVIYNTNSIQFHFTEP